MGATPTFMAKYADDLDGCGGHIHQSLWSAGRRNERLLGRGRRHTSPSVMGHYVAGVLATLPEFMLMYAPNVNSYKRYVARTWAPTNLTWGIDNRTAALRAIVSSPEAIRIENRAPGADLNPYLAFAATLAGGLHGIEKGLEPPPTVQGQRLQDARRRAAAELAAPGARGLRSSELARLWFGDEFCDQYIAFREWEVEKHRRAVTTGSAAATSRWCDRVGCASKVRPRSSPAPAAAWAALPPRCSHARARRSSPLTSPRAL